MGRPRLANAKKVVVAVRLSASEVEALDATRKGLTRSAYIRRAVVRGLSSVTELPEPPPQHPVPLAVVHQQPVRPDPSHPHLHRMVDTDQIRFIKGTKQTLGRCKDPDCNHERWS